MRIAVRSGAPRSSSAGRWASRALGLVSFVSCQNEYSLLARGPDHELIPMMRANGIGLLPYYPLASGLLTGKYRRNTPMPEGARLTLHGARYGSRFINDANWPIVERLETFAEQRGRTLLELAFSWLASRPCVSSIIAGANGPNQQPSVNARSIRHGRACPGLSRPSVVSGCRF
jgi:aryl-alcohol dehydrogenase-like predicted oxidoreductase